MDATVTQKLRLMIQENGRSLLHNPKRCEEIMAGELADFASTARVLRLALHRGIPSALAENGRSEAEIARHVLALQQEGVPELKARDAVAAWAEAIGAAPAPRMEAPRRVPTAPDPLASPSPVDAAPVPPAAIPAVKAQDIPAHRAAALVTFGAIAVDLIAGIALLPSLPMAAVVFDVVLLAGGAALYQKNSRAIAWLLCAVACFRGIAAVIALAPTGSVGALATFLILTDLAMARFCFQAATVKTIAETDAAERNKLVQEAQ